MEQEVQIEPTTVTTTEKPKPNNRIGNCGRKQNFNEPTIAVSFKVPLSLVELFKEKARQFLDKRKVEKVYKKKVKYKKKRKKVKLKINPDVKKANEAGSGTKKKRVVSQESIRRKTLRQHYPPVKPGEDYAIPS
jgi:hypothetical protein